MTHAVSNSAVESAPPFWLVRPVGRFRTALYFTVNLAAFVAVNAFWRFLATGRWLDVQSASYYNDLATPLGEIFRHPLDVLAYPWMIIVTGLLLGLVVLVPVLMAVLYRPAFSVAFVAAVVLIGHAPMLALATGIGCVLAGWSRLQKDMPFLASVLGLLPAAAYGMLSAFASVDAAAVLPLQRWALYAPFLIAFVAAVLGGAIVLGFARIVGMRSGPLVPLLVLLLAAPAAVFHEEVGPDELNYTLIVNRLQVDGSIFEDEALGPWSRRNRAEGLNAQAVRVRVREELHARRDRLIERCERFLRQYGDSPRGPAVMWLRAQAASLQVDEVALAGGLIKYAPSFPLDESAEAWEALRSTYPASPQAVLADWRLGELSLRAAARASAHEVAVLLRKADEHLQRAAQALDEMFPAAADQFPEPDRAMMFIPPADVPSRDYFLGAKRQVDRLAWLVEGNAVLSDANSAEALGAYLAVNPKLPDYYRRLGDLLSDKAKQREGTPMGDNLMLAIALHAPNVYERAEMLIQLARNERTDAAIAANFELGKLALKPAEDPGVLLIPDLKTPEQYFRTVIAAPPNPYQQEAARLLAQLAARPKEKD